MSQVNEYILSILALLSEGTKDTILLKTNNNPLLFINKEQICIGKANTETKLVTSSTKTTRMRVSSTKKLFAALNGYHLVLNHVGIGYTLEEVDKEVEYYKDLAQQNFLHLYEEEGNDKMVRWLFIGDVTQWKDPLYEIVLSQRPQIQEDTWYPHIQIDIDTQATDEFLEEICSNIFGTQFIQWNINIPDYGIVLKMGRLGIYNGINIWLGIGTHLRNTQYHREHLELIA